MLLFGVELACITCLDNGGGILKHLGPVEAAPEDLANKGARRGLVAIFADVYVSDEHSAFLGGNTFECNSIWALAVQVPVEDEV